MFQIWLSKQYAKPLNIYCQKITVNNTKKAQIEIILEYEKDFDKFNWSTIIDNKIKTNITVKNDILESFFDMVNEPVFASFYN